MTTQNTLRTGRNAAPLVELIQNRPSLKPSVTSPASSYVSKQPDKIERPTWHQGKLGQLTDALTPLVPELNRWAAVEEKRFREEEFARGKQLRQANKVAFAELTHNNPELLGRNPYVRKGYIAAELEALSIQHKAHLDDWYTREAAGETDPEKIKAGADAVSAAWIAENIASNADLNGDPELYDAHFYQPAAAAMGTLMQRHTADAAVEHVRRNEDAYGKLITSMLDDGFINTPGLGHPDTFTTHLTDQGAALSMLMPRMQADGVPPTIAAAIVKKAIFSYAASLGGEESGAMGPQALKLLDHIRTPDGQPLSADASTRAAIEQQTTAWRNERRSTISFNQQQADRRRQENDRNATYTAHNYIADRVEANQPMPSHTDLMKLPGITPEQGPLMQAVLDKGIALRNQKLQIDPERQREVATLRWRALRGELPMEELFDKAGYIGWDAMHEMQNIIHNTALSGSDPLTVTLNRIDVGRAWRLAGTQLALAGEGAATAEREQLDAATHEVVVAALQDFEDDARKYVAEHGKPMSAAEAEKRIHSSIIEYGKDPAFHNFTTPQPIRRQEEIAARYPELEQARAAARNPNFEHLMPRTQELITSPPFPKTVEGKNKAGDLIMEYFKDPQGTGQRIATEYGIGAADVPGLMDGWSIHMLGVPLNTIHTGHRAEESPSRTKSADKER